MTDTPPTTSPPKRLPRPLRVAILLFSITLGSIFVLFAAAAVIMPSTKSSRIDWSQRQEDEAEAASTQPAQPVSP